MSFSVEEARSFFDPLVGKTTTFLVDGRQANFRFARTIMGLVGVSGDTCTVLDLDAFYSSNAEVTAPLAGTGSTLRVPSPGTDVEEGLSMLFGVQQFVVVIDSLNTLYHLISITDGSLRSRKLSFAIAALSHFARINGKVVVLCMYRREGFGYSRPSRSISSLSDITASASLDGDGLTFRTERGTAWPGGRFAIRVLSG
jgi:hypothetical protein